MEVSRVTPSLCRACIRRFLPQHQLHLRGLQTQGFKTPYGREDRRGEGKTASQNGRGGRDAFQHDSSKSRPRTHEGSRGNREKYDARLSKGREDYNHRPPRSFQSESHRRSNEDGFQRTSRSEYKSSPSRREERSGRFPPAKRPPRNDRQPAAPPYERKAKPARKTTPHGFNEDDAKFVHSKDLIEPEIYDVAEPEHIKYKGKEWNPYPKGSTDEMSDLLQSYPQDKATPSSRQVAYASRFFEATKSPMLYSVKLLEDFPDSEFPEVLFVGRNNAGKSTLLNTLLRCASQEKVVPVQKHARPVKTNSFDGYLVTDDKALSAEVLEAGPKKSDRKVAEEVETEGEETEPTEEASEDSPPLEAEEITPIERALEDSPREAQESNPVEEASEDSSREVAEANPIEEASEGSPGEVEETNKPMEEATADPLPKEETTLQSNEAPQARPRGLVVIDSAGYGHGNRPSFGEEIQKVIETRKQLRHVFVVTDPHHGLKGTDLNILLWLRKMSFPHTLMLGKIDKVTSKNNYWSQAKKARAVIRAMEMIQKRREELDKLANDGREFDLQVLCASGEHSFVKNKGAGVERLRQGILEVCGMEPDLPEEKGEKKEKKALVAEDLTSASPSADVSKEDGQVNSARHGLEKHTDVTAVEAEAVDASEKLEAGIEPNAEAENAHEVSEEDAQNKTRSKDANVE